MRAGNQECSSELAGLELPVRHPRGDEQLGG